MPPNTPLNGITGRCYCGAFSISAAREPQTVAYCHCVDCKRWTGAPLPAFAAFHAGNITATPPFCAPLEVVKGVQRWACSKCGSPMAASFDYLPDQIYVPLGVLDQADRLRPAIHCHTNAQLPWLHLNDGLPREVNSARKKTKVIQCL